MTENSHTTSAAIEAEANQPDTKVSLEKFNRALADAIKEFQDAMIVKGVNPHIWRSLILNMVFGFLATVCYRLEVDSAWACKVIITLWPLTVEKSRAK